MTNAVATISPTRPKSVTMDMADRYGMDHVAFERTLRATVFPQSAPAEEFAAFLLVAKEYKLNPITKEIYAFPKKGGGIIPIVSIDGWMNLINSHPAFDGMDFDEAHNEAGDLVSIRCTIFRKDRSHPVAVTEYLLECIRPTDPWKMKHRMLRHKSAIQCARYAFGFAGIYDEDEGERIAANAAKEVSAHKPPAPPPVAAIEHRAVGLDGGNGAFNPAAPSFARPPPPPEARAQEVAPVEETLNIAALLQQFADAAKGAIDPEKLLDVWNEIVQPHYDSMIPSDQASFDQAFRWREAEVGDE